MCDNHMIIFFFAKILFIFCFPKETSSLNHIVLFSGFRFQETYCFMGSICMRSDGCIFGWVGVFTSDFGFVFKKLVVIMIVGYFEVSYGSSLLVYQWMC